MAPPARRPPPGGGSHAPARARRRAHRPRAPRPARPPPLPLETSLPGVFAAGDVRRGSVNRVASAVGEGAATIPLVHRYLHTTTAAGRRGPVPPSLAGTPAARTQAAVR